MDDLQNLQSVGARLKAARGAAKLSQAGLAKLSGVNQQNISALETGRAKSSSDLPALARACSVSVYWLSSGEGSMSGCVGTDIASLAQQLSLETRALLQSEAHLGVVSTTLEAAIKLLDRPRPAEAEKLRKSLASVESVIRDIEGLLK